MSEREREKATTVESVDRGASEKVPVGGCAKTASRAGLSDPGGGPERMHKSTQTPGSYVTLSTKNYDVYGSDQTPRAGADAAVGPRVIACNLNSPANLGSIFRLMGCFNMNRLDHVYTSVGRKRKARAPPEWADDGRRRSMQQMASGCDTLVTRRLVPVDLYIEHLRRANDERWPVVAIETATSAVSLNTFQFPKRCAIMVGAEGRGIDPAVMKALRPGYDAFVIIPMLGPHKSLNVATALGVALYEYRRQWPEG